MKTILQFGEGGFLRGFVDYFVHEISVTIFSSEK